MSLLKGFVSKSVFEGVDMFLFLMRVFQQKNELSKSRQMHSQLLSFYVQISLTLSGI